MIDLSFNFQLTDEQLKVVCKLIDEISRCRKDIARLRKELSKQ